MAKPKNRLVALGATALLFTAGCDPTRIPIPSVSPEVDPPQVVTPKPLPVESSQVATPSEPSAPEPEASESPSEPAEDLTPSEAPESPPEVATLSESPVAFIDEMTGAAATTDTLAQWQIGGTDLGIMWDDGNGQVLAAFGDTFATPAPEGAGTGLWRSNVILGSRDQDLHDGMSFDWALTDGGGVAVEAFPGLHNEAGGEVTKIPTGGIEVGGVQYLTYMSVARWGEAGQWFTSYSQLAYSRDGGQTWSEEGAPRWENNDAHTDPFQMVSFVKHEGHVYMFGTPNGRLGNLHVARVPEAEMMNKGAYQYWDGASWQSDLGKVVPIVEGPISETSTRFDPFTGSWQLIYLNGNADLVLRQAEQPTGPWGEEQVLATQRDYPGLYGGYIHPWSRDGDVYIAMSTWNQYNVSLMQFTQDQNGSIVRPNLLVDPSFERSDALGAPDGWQVNGSGGIDTESAWAKQGYRQFWVRFNQGEHEVFQRVQVRPQTRYRLTSWLRTGDQSGGGAGEGFLGARSADGDVLAEEKFGDLGTYTRQVVEFESGDHQEIEVYAGSSMTADRWVQGDNFTLVEILR